MNGNSSNTSGANVAAIDFARKSGSDAIADVHLDEIARRLVITFEEATQGNVVFSPTPPDDKTKAWWQTDPVTGIPLGQPRIYDSTQSAWVAIDVTNTYTPPAKRYLKERVVAGASTVLFQFDDILTENYEVSLEWTTQNADGTWAAAPATYPAQFGYIIAARTNTFLTVNAYAVPTGGLMLQGCIEAIPS